MVPVTGPVSVTGPGSMWVPRDGPGDTGKATGPVLGALAARLVVIRENDHVPVGEPRMVMRFPLARTHRHGRRHQPEQRHIVSILLALEQEDGCVGR